MEERHVQSDVAELERAQHVQIVIEAQDCGMKLRRSLRRLMAVAAWFLEQRFVPEAHVKGFRIALCQADRARLVSSELNLFLDHASLVVNREQNGIRFPQPPYFVQARALGCHGEKRRFGKTIRR